MRKRPGTCIFEDSCVLAAGELWLKRRAAMTSQLLMTVHTSSAHSGHRGPSGGGSCCHPLSAMATQSGERVKTDTQ